MVQFLEQDEFVRKHGKTSRQCTSELGTMQELLGESNQRVNAKIVNTVL